MWNLLKNTVEVTIFREKETNLFTFSNGIRRIEDTNTEVFDMVYRFLGPNVKAKVDEILKKPIEDPNTQKALKNLYEYKNI